MSLEGRYEQVAAELRQVQGEKENLHDELMMTKDVPLIIKVKAAECHVNIFTLFHCIVSSQASELTAGAADEGDASEGGTVGAGEAITH